jgi:hypothetical protein
MGTARAAVKPQLREAGWRIIAHAAGVSFKLRL